jgi:hypothetical protein
VHRSEVHSIFLIASSVTFQYAASSSGSLISTKILFHYNSVSNIYHLLRSCIGHLVNLNSIADLKVHAWLLATQFLVPFLGESC